MARKELKPTQKCDFRALYIDLLGYFTKCDFSYSYTINYICLRLQNKQPKLLDVKNCKERSVRLI